MHMPDRTLLAIHDRIDDEHFEVHLLKGAVAALQRTVHALEAQVRELQHEVLELQEVREERKRA